jgi:hypothetical protein
LARKKKEGFMNVDIKIVSKDYELVFDLVGSRRFPERKEVVCPGNAVMSSQSLKPAGEGDYTDDIIEITMTFNEDSSVEEFAKWFFHTLAERDEAIVSLVIGGKETPLGHDEVESAIKDAVK